MLRLRELKPEELAWRCDPESLGFATTDEIEPENGPIGQERALAALDLGLHMAADGYNIFVMGLPGTGRRSMTQAFAEKIAASLPTPPDWCYVYNFDDPRRPKAICLPPGRGVQFRRDADQFVEDVRREITRALESDEYSQERDQVIKSFRDERQRELDEFEQEARSQNFAVGRTPGGLMLAPMLGGEVMTPQQFAELPEAQRQEIEARRQALEKRLEEIMRRAHRLEREARRAVQELDRKVVSAAVEGLIEDFKARYQDVPAVAEHLDRIQQDIAENAELYWRMAMGEGEHQINLPPPLQPKPPYERYRVNVLVSNQEGQGAPVVYEANPTVQNLTGRIEYQAQMGALVTDFTMVHAGALHRAAGGFLILDAYTLLTRPFAWDALKRLLKERKIRIESLAEHLGLISTVSLEPEPIPLQAKVIVIGTPLIYYLLYAYDPDFPSLFRVYADFDWVNPRSEDRIRAYAGFIARKCKEENLPAFSAGAVARVLEYAARDAEDQYKLSGRFNVVENLVREAAFWARRAGHQVVQPEDVEEALRQKIWRSNRIEERLTEYIRRGVIMVRTSGQAVGQVNGISLIPVGDYPIGLPSRITARSYAGQAGVVDIEREVKLSGPIHDKGCMIIEGFLGQRYAQDQPLSCSVTLTFEQTYDEVEGDSASSAELYAILSSLSGLPLRQDLAVTGSVDQHGNIQPVGGVNRKIEGFFAVCKEVGLTGTQGVIIPEANTANLMLRDEVIEAVRQGQFHIYAVSNVDEAMELLTGVPAGAKDQEGKFPADTINWLVQKRLRELAEARRQFASPEEEEERRKSRGDEESPQPREPEPPRPEGDEQ